VKSSTSEEDYILFSIGNQYSSGIDNRIRSHQLIEESAKARVVGSNVWRYQLHIKFRQITTNA
jgi:hypothetical protein